MKNILTIPLRAGSFRNVLLTFTTESSSLAKELLSSLFYLTRIRRFTGDHARQNESHVENISSTNSPTALERRYEQFYDHERMDAVDAIENCRIQNQHGDKWAEIEDKYTACLIFEVSEHSEMKHFVMCNHHWV